MCANDLRSVRQILTLVERLEKENPEPKPLASDAINGEWRLRWTTSESILGRNRMRGFRVDLHRPILQVPPQRLCNMSMSGVWA